MQDDGLEVFADVLELATDTLREYLEGLEYPTDQVDEVSELFQDRLGSYLSSFIEDLPEPDVNEDDV